MCLRAEKLSAWDRLILPHNKGVSLTQMTAPREGRRHSYAVDQSRAAMIMISTL